MECLTSQIQSYRCFFPLIMILSNDRFDRRATSATMSSRGGPVDCGFTGALVGSEFTGLVDSSPTTP